MWNRGIRQHAGSTRWLKQTICKAGVTVVISVQFDYKGLGSRRAEIGPAIEMHTDLKYVYMVYSIEKNRNFICLVLKL